MSDFDASIYKQLRNKAISEGSAEIAVALDSPLAVPKFKKWLINMKNRDKAYGSNLGRYKFTVTQGAEVIITAKLSSTAVAFVLKEAQPEHSVKEAVESLKGLEFPDLGDTNEH